MKRTEMVNDFLALIAELWDVEQLNMWCPQHHLSLAYLFDRSYAAQDYHENFESWLSLAQKKDFNEFAWTISQAVGRFYLNDDLIRQSDKNNFKRILAWQKTFYDDKRLTVFGFVREKYAPEWFFGLFGSYIGLEELKRENALVAYMENECSMSANEAKEVYKKLYEHYDILNEFYFYVKNNRFATFNPITVKGSSAQQLVESCGLSPFGAYNFLVYLRESS